MKYSENGFYVCKQDDFYLIGLSEKGQDDLGDVSFLEILSSDKMDVNDSLIGVEASKAVTELTAPLNAVILEVNERVVNQPNLLNAPVSLENWLFKVNQVDVVEYETLSNEINL